MSQQYSSDNRVSRASSPLFVISQAAACGKCTHDKEVFAWTHVHRYYPINCLENMLHVRNSTQLNTIMPNTRSKGRHDTVAPRGKPAARAQCGKSAGVTKPHTAKKRAVQPRLASALQKEAIRLSQAAPSRSQIGTEDAVSVPRVTRICNPTQSWTKRSLFFVWSQSSGSTLCTSEDTETITLNLLDFLAQPEHWIPELSWLKLHAAAFLFASRTTGLSNTPQDVVHAINAFVEDAGVRSLLAEGVRIVFGVMVGDEEVARAVRVEPQDVEAGYGMLLGRIEELKHLLGEYAGNLGDEAVHEAVAPSEVVMLDEQSLYDDLDIFAEPE